jgi:tRNA pseudouridine55 synthase
MAESGLVIVAKPGGMTSHDVVTRIRKLAGTRRVGHAGTLDPMATGVLVIGIEKATRLLGYLALSEKEYSATIRLGQSTVTDDAEGELLPVAADAAARVRSIDEGTLAGALAAFAGEIMQVPPKVSAIKVNGQRAYRLTRSGAAPELTARPVTIRRLDLLAWRQAGHGLADVDVAVTCSSGTYIRAIARDLGAALGTGGHLTVLRRTRVGPYEIGAAKTLDQLAQAFAVIPLALAAAAAFSTLRLTADEARLVSHGGSIRVPGREEGALVPSAAPAKGDGHQDAALEPAQTDAEPAGTSAPQAARDEPVAAFGPDGDLIALLVSQDGELRPLAVFAS